MRRVEKKMKKQRKVLITITYNEMGIIIDTKAEELGSFVQPEPCEDAVSRKAVKDGFVEMCSLICPYTEKQRHTMCGSCLLETAFDVLEATQPVTPKQRTGHWHITDAYPHNVYCSECHKRFAQTHWAVWEDGSLPRNFCPNCGAKMTEGDAE